MWSVRDAGPANLRKLSLQVSWGEQLWMYVVNGSGLWYRAGRTLLCSDTLDLAIYLNATSWYKRRTSDSKPPLFELAIHRLGGTIDSISFEHHSEKAFDI